MDWMFFARFAGGAFTNRSGVMRVVRVEIDVTNCFPGMYRVEWVAGEMELEDGLYRVEWVAGEIELEDGLLHTLIGIIGNLCFGW